MKKNTGAGRALAVAGSLLRVSPHFAGDWRQTELNVWKYIRYDGTNATGWLEVDGNRYYLDENGNRKSDYWYKENGSWYYLDEDGVMAKNTWIDNYYVDSTGRFEKKR